MKIDSAREQAAGLMIEHFAGQISAMKQYGIEDGATNTKSWLFGMELAFLLVGADGLAKRAGEAREEAE